jgi:hypothetical protein
MMIDGPLNEIKLGKNILTCLSSGDHSDRQEAFKKCTCDAVIALCVTVQRATVALLLALSVVMAACTPSLNWRTAQIDQLTALLPCKPEHAERTVQLGHTHVRMEMRGCEASQSLFAISHIKLSDAQQVESFLAAWQEVTLANMQATGVDIQYFKLSQSAAGIVQASQPVGKRLQSGELELLVAQGQRADSSGVQAYLSWFARGSDLYHVAAYGSRQDYPTIELLFTGLSLQ